MSVSTRFACRIADRSLSQGLRWIQPAAPKLAQARFYTHCRHPSFTATPSPFRLSTSQTKSHAHRLPSSSIRSLSLNESYFSTSSPLSENSNHVYTSPYKAKRIWPPDMSQLSSKQQFRLERKYRRRAKLKWARPTWKKWTKLVQWSLIGFVLIYSVFFMELKDGGNNPFGALRDYMRKFFSESVWSTPQGSLRRASNADVSVSSHESKQG